MASTEHDPDMTVHLPGAAAPTPACALKPGELPDDDQGNALPAGTRMGEFELLSMIGEGGFGIVYLAQDHSLHRKVAIKEYMPSALAARTQAMTVSVRSRRHAETFEAGLRSFVNEARLLAQFDHPSLIKVYRFWEANGTAYMVMPLYTGRTLAATLKALPAPPDEVWLRSLLAPVLDALEVMHRADTFHRDIAPDNIMVLEDGRPVVLDLGAARRVIGDMTQALTVILKTCYAPIEQYGEMPGVKQGPWTDLYALGSVVYFAITGQTPPQSVTRVMTDKYVPLAQAVAGHYSPAFLEAIDACLAVLPQHRPQSIAALRALFATPPSPVPSPTPAPTPAPTITLPVPEPAPPPRPQTAMPAGPAPQASRGQGRWIAGGVVALLGAGGLAYTLMRPAALPAPVSIAPAAPATVLVPQPPATAPVTVPEAPAPVPPPVAPVVAAPATPPAAPVTRPRPPAPAPAPAPVDKVAKPAPAPAPAAQRTDTAYPTENDKPPLSPQGYSEDPTWSPNGRPPKVVRVNPPSPDYVTQVKCNDLLQKSALGDPVTAADREFIRKECR
ncbi:serine/threonine-protein kinase [Sphaerotilus sp.]|uniref:serine/threonine protein kinase n=1 Tax=Sphaerotilus sp. TaxID=2093942 RepID=UPI002ACD6EFF|nr:serine/threonine-protein kinase [Sphaerotilus sp.]MDZ7856478.1 serine/threonine-protein kinase [Sphaerotilus sp.]